MEDKLDVRFQELEDKLKNMTEEDRAHIRDAYQYARVHHEGQLRKDGSPYITHPLEVAHLVAGGRFSCACWRESFCRREQRCLLL